MAELIAVNSTAVIAIAISCPVMSSATSIGGPGCRRRETRQANTSWTEGFIRRGCFEVGGRSPKADVSITLRHVDRRSRTGIGVDHFVWIGLHCKIQQSFLLGKN
jgi:hypothetical protein